MTDVEILEELRKLSLTQRVRIIEAALNLIAEDLKVVEQLNTSKNAKRQLELAAETLLADYSKGGELTEFTALDHEDFYIECTCS